VYAAEFPDRLSSTYTTMNVNKPFVSLAKLQLPVSSRLLPSACCPDKDLVVTISPQNGKDHVSLWKMQGSKKWEVDVRSDSVRNETIIDLAWSPDGVLR
jgi:anaphase-promoting complex subunit 4